MAKWLLIKKSSRIINIYSPYSCSFFYITQKKSAGLLSSPSCQGLKLGLLHCGQILYRLSHQRSPHMLEKHLGDLALSTTKEILFLDYDIIIAQIP